MSHYFNFINTFEIKMKTKVGLFGIGLDTDWSEAVYE